MRALLAAILSAVMLLTACSTVDTTPIATPTPSATLTATATPTPTRLPTPSPTATPAVPRYQAVNWNQIPGWPGDHLSASFKTWQNGCIRLQTQAPWRAICTDATRIPANDDGAIRSFIESRFTPLQIFNPDGSSHGLITGYYEPVYPGSLVKTATARHPLYGLPKDLITVALDDIYPELKGKRLRGKIVGQKLIPYPDRADIVRKGIDAPVLAWLHDPLDVQFMQIQGSGRVQLPTGETLRLGYADQNGRPYVPVGRWLVQQGKLPASEVSMQSIRSWANANPAQIEALLNSNPSYVFFRALPASSEGPIGSMNFPLTAENSIAVDPGTIALGSPVFISTTRPDNNAPIQKLVAAQDTGGAIRGSVRADFFWGTGNLAGELAGKMKQAGQLWLLWPKEMELPK